jgi:MoaA/NifB/PqqE/SkfB family radical SAM enzyme
MESADLPTALPTELIVVWRVFESCSLACGFCGYSRDLAWSRKSALPRDILTFGRILGEVQRLAGSSLLISWLGGEPLAWNELPAISCDLNEHSGLRLGVTTNGIPLGSADIRRSLLQHFEQVTISIDGPGKFHDHIRGQAGLFEQLRENIGKLHCEDRDERLWRRVNIVLMRDNIAGFADFAEEMAAWGFHELTFNQLGGNERPDFFSKHRLLRSQVERFARELPDLKRALANRGLLISGNERYLSRLRASAADEPIPIDDCQPGTHFLFIDAVGRISPCSFSSVEYGIPIAEIQSAAQFLDLSERFRLLRAKRRLPACDDCHATHVFDKFEHPVQVLPLQGGVAG